MSYYRRFQTGIPLLDGFLVLSTLIGFAWLVTFLLTLLGGANPAIANHAGSPYYHARWIRHSIRTRIASWSPPSTAPRLPE